MSGQTRRLLTGHALASLAISLPWPLLLAAVWERSGDPWLLGLVGALRMLPYAACSWWLPAVADRWGRRRVLRATVWARLALLATVAVALPLGALTLAVAAATLAVLAATPAYPALAASLPSLAGHGARRATDLLVTVEVSSFVVGPALGGLLLVTRPEVTSVAAVVAAASGAWLLGGVRLPAPAGTASGGQLRALRSGSVLRSLGLLAGLNAVLAVAGLALLPLSGGSWSGGWASEHAYGVASAVLGFGALAAPALARLGRSSSGRSRLGLGALALALVVVAAAPSVAWSLVPLVLAGAAAVHVEGAVTGALQEAVADRHRAGVLGAADAVMVGAAMLGSLVAPTLAEGLGGPVLLVLLGGSALGCCLLAPASGRAAADDDGGVAVVVADEARLEPRLLQEVG